jgi:hypothetical protein
LEGITPDFLGWVGYYFWEGYALKLDYRRSRVTLYKGPPELYLSAEKVIAELPFEIRKLPNHPVMHIRIGGLDIIAAFDTGQYGALYTDAPRGPIKKGAAPPRGSAAPGGGRLNARRA